MLTTRPATFQQVDGEGGASSGSRPVLVDASRDQAVRWEPGERLHHVFDDRLAAFADAPAFELDGADEPGGVRVLTTADVSRRADQTARLLRAAGAGPGARVALVLDQADRACTAMVAVSRLHAAYVPLDAAFPPDRVAYVCADAGVRVLLTTARLRGREVPDGVVVVEVEDADALPDGPLTADETGEPVDELAYVVYTSGTTGRPKGVAVEHASIVSFVRVAAGCYGYRPDDRVYQGMTVAFDFSVEESWVPWAAGAVLVPKPAGTSLVGAKPQDFLVSRRATGRTGVVFFTDAFHGMSLGALSVTGNSTKRRGAGVPLHHTTPVPYDRSVPGSDHAVLERMLVDPSSGLDLPAAVIVETVQGEGGLTAARAEWLQSLAELCRSHEVLLIVDDVQMGVGRTGGFFSFEEAGITPDVVVLSKSISGYGLPMSLVLIRPEVDVWKPGEHNGTFRGNNPAFITAEAALRTFWADDALERSTLAKGERVHDGLCRIVADVVRRGGADGTVRGRGLARGLVLDGGGLAGRVSAEAYALGLLVETSGPHDEVVKLLPALTTSDDDLDTGLALLAEATARALA